MDMHPQAAASSASCSPTRKSATTRRAADSGFRWEASVATGAEGEEEEGEGLQSAVQEE